METKVSTTDRKRILICRTGGIGDVIQTLPLVRYIKSKSPLARIEYLTSGDIKGLLVACCPYIDHVWEYSKEREDKLSREILQDGQKIDYFINLHSSYKFAIFNFLKIKAKKYFQYKKNNKLHAVINFAKTFDTSISAFSLPTKTIFVEEPKKNLNLYKLAEKKYLCFVVGVGSIRPNRGWSIENWIMLAKKFLISNPEFKIVLLGGKNEQRILQNWYKLSKVITEPNNDQYEVSFFNGKAIDLTGKLNLEENAKLISKSYLLVSCDTGLLHLASGLSIKAIGLFGPTSSERTGPLCGNSETISKPCDCKKQIINFFSGEPKSCRKTKMLMGECLSKITPNDVLSRITHEVQIIDKSWEMKTAGKEIMY